MKRSLIMNVALVCGFTFGISTILLAEESKGPVGVWKFEEESGKALKDSSGNGNDGTLSGPDDFIRVAGRSGKGIEGKGEYLKGGAIVIGGLSEKYDYFKKGLTVETWFKFNTMDRMQHEIISNTLGDNGKGFRLRFQGDWMYFSIGDGTKSVHAITDMVKNPIKPNQWYHVAGVYDAGKLKIYIDGELAAQNPQTAMTLDGGEKSVYIGAYRGGYAYRFNSGLIDEVKIYDYPRTDAQILGDARAE